MQNILAKKLVGMTDLREPKKMIEKANGEPVAIMNRNEVAGYFVPASAVEQVSFSYVSDEDLEAVLKQQDELLAEGLAYLKDR